MTSNRQKVIAIVIVAIVILTSASFIVLSRGEPSLADRMLIHSGDLEPGWREVSRRALNYAVNDSFSLNLTSAECVVMNRNSSYMIAHIFVFNSSEDCHQWFEERNCLYALAFDVQDVAIGDVGFIMKAPPGLGANAYFGIVANNISYQIDPSRFVGMMFIQDNVMAYMDVFEQGESQVDQAWLTTFILSVGAIQLERINHHLL
jgi:hypothetical protein